MGLGRVTKLGALLGLELILLSNLACGNNVQPKPTSTATRPAATATYTPSPTATPFLTPTPTPVYQEVQGINVPTNAYLEGDSCIPFELQGVEKCVNMFVYGESPTVPSTWKGIVHVIGDLIINSLTIEPGTEVYVAANSDINNLQLYPGNMSEGINNTNKNIEGVHPGEYFYDEGHHISIEVDNILTAEGTEDQPVLITSSAIDPMMGDWNSLYFNRGIIDYATIEYARPVEPLISGTIQNSTIRHISGGGIVLWYAENVIIQDNVFYDTAHELIDIHNSNVKIIGNTIGPNERYVFPSGYGYTGAVGIILDLSEGGEAIVIDNTIQGNDGAGIVILSEPENLPIIQENIFRDNKSDISCESGVNYCTENQQYILQNNTFE